MVDESSSEYNIVVNGIVDFTESPHKNKKAYNITLQKDVGSNNYRSRIGYSLYPQDIGKFTMIFEFFQIDSTNIQLSSQATTAYIHKQVQRDFTGYSKLLVQINNTCKDTPDRIYFTMHGTTTIAPVQAHLVVYGIKDWSDSVSPEVYDHDFNDQMFVYKNGDMQMQSNIDMNNQKIIHIPNPTDAEDACNKRSLDSLETKIIQLLPPKNVYEDVFGTHFYDLLETSKFNFIKGVSGVVISGLSPNLVLETDRFITDYNPKYGLKLSTKGHIKMDKIMNQSSSFTFFMSFLHDSTKTAEISFLNTLNLHIKFFPRYQITSSKIMIVTPSTDYETQFTSDFKNKQRFIWICYDGSKNLHKMSLSNYSSRVNEVFSPPNNFQSLQLELNLDAFVNKIGFIDRFIDIDSLEFHRIMLEEKKKMVLTKNNLNIEYT